MRSLIARLLGLDKLPLELRDGHAARLAVERSIADET